MGQHVSRRKNSNIGEKTHKSSNASSTLQQNNFLHSHHKFSSEVAPAITVSRTSSSSSRNGTRPEHNSSQAEEESASQTPSGPRKSKKKKGKRDEDKARYSELQAWRVRAWEP